MSSSNSTGQPSRPRVLIVDDEAELAQVLSELLTPHGFDIHTAAQGSRALELLAKDTFDILLVDLMMPDFDGISVLKRAFEIDPNLVTVMMTGRGTVQTAIEAMRLGAFDYLQKPFKLETVMNVLKRAVALRQLRLDNVHLRDLLSVYELGQAVSASLQRDLILSKTAQAALQQFQADEVSILLAGADPDYFEVAQVEEGGREGIIGVRVGRRGTLSGWVADSRETLVIEGPVQDERFRPAAARNDIRVSISMPMIAGNRLAGVIHVNLVENSAYTQGQVKGLSLLVGIAAAALENARLFDSLQSSNRKLRRAYTATIEGWSRALDLRDHETEGHTQRVTDLTLQLASQFPELSLDDLEQIRLGALLHDIGKMGVPDEILLKPGKLTREETEIMRKHPVYAYELLQPIEHLRPALDIPYAHHERWDGRGYPRGLSGEQIPLAVRIFTLADVWDALRSDRPYRKRWSEAETLGYIRAQSGRRFDPRVVAVFLQMLGVRI